MTGVELVSPTFARILVVTENRLARRNCMLRLRLRQLLTKLEAELLDKGDVQCSESSSSDLPPCVTFVQVM